MLGMGKAIKTAIGLRNNAFAPVSTSTPPPAVYAPYIVMPRPTAPTGFFVNFIGQITRTSFLPSALEEKLSGRYFGYPGDPEYASPPLHDACEWSMVLRSVSEADRHFTFMELGAGWGPWSVAVNLAAKRRGLQTTIVAVEASEQHRQFMTQHLADNDIRDDAVALIAGLVSVADGDGYLTEVKEARENYAASVAMNEDRAVRVPALSLRQLLQAHRRIDLIHCDIQGAEADVLDSAANDLQSRVRRIIVGTHGRGIEDRLIHLFTRLGWRIEDESPCRFNIKTGTPSLVCDGVQIWRNLQL